MRKTFAVMAVLAIGACGSEEDGMRSIEFASELNVDVESMTRTATGLQYQDLVVGDGAEAASGRRVFVHYTGWLVDGTKFDSSVDRGTPFDFALGVGEVIAGWDEGVAGMRVGGKRKLVIPPELGYGRRGHPGVIPPQATLVFDVELLDVR